MEKQDNPQEEHQKEIGSYKKELEDILQEIKTALHNLVVKEKSAINLFKFRHKILFAFLVFFAINLVWYGMWEIISELPFLNKPIVALITGAVILIATEFFYENLISADFDKQSRQKKIRENQMSKRQEKSNV